MLYRLGLLASAAAIFAVPAAAQDAPRQEQTESQVPSGQEQASDETIVVTATRTARLLNTRDVVFSPDRHRFELVSPGTRA